MKKIVIIIILLFFVLMNGCNTDEEDITQTNDIQQLDNNETIKKRNFVKEFETLHLGQEIVYSIIDDFDNDNSDECFIVTGKQDPKVWFLTSQGNTDIILEVWGNYKKAIVLDRNNKKHFALICNYEPSITQVWVFCVEEYKANEIFTSIADYEIKAVDNNFEMTWKRYDAEGKYDLAMNKYIWDEYKQTYVKEGDDVAFNNENEEDNDLKEKQNNNEEVHKISHNSSLYTTYIDKETQKFGYKDKNGNVVIKPQYDYARKFSEERAIVEINGKYGCIDKYGNLIIKAKYDNIRDFTEGLAAAKSNNKWGYISKAGDIQIEFKFDDVVDFSEGLAAVKITGEWGYINNIGDMVIKPQFDSFNSFKNGRVDVKYGGKSGMMTKDGMISWMKFDTYKEIQLLPVDESNKNQDFKQFYNDLLIAIQNKDTEFIIHHLNTNIQFSFGLDSGIEGFLQKWKLHKNPRESSFWLEIEKTLKLGGVFSNKSKTEFIAPYIFANFPDSFDCFEYDVCIDDNVSVYLRPEIKSLIIKNLKYHIIKVLDRNINTLDPSGKTVRWSKIQLPNGSRGYVKSEYLRSSIDYRAMFSKDEDGIWKMDVFIAGD